MAPLCHAWHWESSRNEGVRLPAHLSPCHLPPVLHPAPDHLSAGDHCRGPGLRLLPAGEGSDVDMQGHTAVSWTRMCRRRVFIGTQTPTPWVTHTQAGRAREDLHVHTHVGWEGHRHTGCSAELSASGPGGGGGVTGGGWTTGMASWPSAPKLPAWGPWGRQGIWSAFPAANPAHSHLGDSQPPGPHNHPSEPASNALSLTPALPRVLLHTPGLRPLPPCPTWES